MQISRKLKADVFVVLMWDGLLGRDIIATRLANEALCIDQRKMLTHAVDVRNWFSAVTDHS
jgi:hypothetical protein